MPSTNPSFSKEAATFSPLWFYIVLYKFGAGIHYAMIAVLGARIFPLWAVGLCVSYASFIELVCDIPAGFLLEKYGYLRLLRLTTVLFIGAALVLMLGLTPVTYFISITLGAFGWLFFTPGINAYLLAHGSSPIIGRLFGVLRASEGAGIMLATLGLPFFVQLPTWAVGLIIFFPLLGALLALAIGSFFRMPDSKAILLPSKRVAAHASLKEMRNAFRRLHPAGTALGIYMTSIACFYGFIWFVFPLLINDGIRPSVLSVSITILEFAMIVSGFTIAHLADAPKKMRLVLVGLGIVVLTSALLGFTLHPLLILICFILSFADELVRITLWAWIDAKSSSQERHAIVAGVINFLEDVGWTIGPAAAGLLYYRIGAIETLRLSGAIVFLAACIITWILLRSKASERAALTLHA